MKLFLATACSLLAFTMSLTAQRVSPPMEASGVIAGKTLTIKYGAPSVRGRDIFGYQGLLAQEKNYPIWRAGADPATAFHTDADLNIGGVDVPKGDYTFYVLVKDPRAWQLVINKQTGQWGLDYDQSKDLGRVKMVMSKPPALVEQLKYTITSTGANSGTISLAWEHHIGTVNVTVK